MSRTRRPPALEMPSLESRLMSYLMLVVAILAQSVPPAPPARAAGVRAAARVRHTAAARSPISKAWWRTSRAPTWCSSASSTTIRTRTASKLALLDGLRRRTVAPTVSLEMFERDVQSVVDKLSRRVDCRSRSSCRRAGRGPATRPTTARWSRSAKREGWTVVAANVPRRIASAVAKIRRARDPAAARRRIGRCGSRARMSP